MTKNNNIVVYMQTADLESLAKLHEALSQIALERNILNEIIVSEINALGINTTKIYLNINKDIDDSRLNALFNNINSLANNNISLINYIYTFDHYLKNKDVYKLFEIDDIMELTNKIVEYGKR